MTFLIGIKETGKFTKIKAKSELEARVKFCKERGLNYRVYCNALEIKTKDGRQTDDKKR
jgi:hypothetical protein